MTKLEALKAVRDEKLTARDAIEFCCSPEWRAAHQEYKSACLAVREEILRLAKNPATRYGDWRTDADKQLMMLGYY